MARIPDLVRDAELEAKLLDGYTVHTVYESNPSSRQRAVPREEFWMVEKHVGGGGFGSIWLEKCVRGSQKDALRAVKRIALGNQKPSDVTYLRELEAVTKFSQRRYAHCFVQSFGWYECTGSLCIAMEYCELGDLQGYLSSNPRLPEQQAQEITFQLLEGMRYMHEHDFAHRDLKPANILIKALPPERWWVKISDFGISKRIEEGLGAPSTVKGTPHFIAPELLTSTSQNTGSLNPYAADMWALGEITFQMLSKQPSFKDSFQLFLYVQNPHASFPVSILTQCEVSTAGETFVSSLMSVSPENRLSATQALDHRWMEQPKISYLDPKPTSDDRYYIEMLYQTYEANWEGSTELAPKLPVVSAVDSLNEQFASWDSALKPDSGLRNPTTGHALQSVGQHSIGINNKTVRENSDREIIETFSSYQILKGHSSPVMSVAFSPDGKSLASGSIDCRIRLWDTATGSPLQTLKGHKQTVSSIAFSPDGKKFASGSWDRMILLWDSVTGSELQRLRGHEGEIYSVAFSPDGKRLASGSYDETVRLWDTATGSELQTLKGHQKTVTSIIFLPDGKKLVSCSWDRMIVLWDTVTGSELRRIRGHEREIYSVALSPDGKWLASGSDYETVQLWDIATGSELQILNGHQTAVTSIVFSLDGKKLVSCSRDRMIVLWDTVTGSELQRRRGHEGEIFSVALSPDGKRLASASYDKTVRLWDAK